MSDKAQRVQVDVVCKHCGMSVESAADCVRHMSTACPQQNPIECRTVYADERPQTTRIDPSGPSGLPGWPIERVSKEEAARRYGQKLPGKSAGAELLEMQAVIDQLLGMTAENIVELVKAAWDMSVTLSLLRPHMKLETHEEWDKLEAAHNKLARATKPFSPEASSDESPSR